MDFEQDTPGSLQALMVAFKEKTKKHTNTQNIPNVQKNKIHIIKAP